MQEKLEGKVMPKIFLPFTNGTQLNNGMDSPNCWAHHSAPLDRQKKKDQEDLKTKPKYRRDNCSKAKWLKIGQA